MNKFSIALFLLFFSVVLSANSLQAPSGTMPVVLLQGSDYEMGYQYGKQLGDYLKIVKDGIWSTVLNKYSKNEVIKKLKMYEPYIKSLKDINYLQILKGMAKGARDMGFDVNYEDVLLINHHVEFELGDTKSCTNMAIWGKTTKDGKTITGNNFDYFLNNAHPYMATIVAWPNKGHTFISHATVGKLANNFVMNNKGLVCLSSKSYDARPEDKGFGISDFIISPYIAMTCKTAYEARNIFMTSKATNGLNHLVVDKNGEGYVIEVTASLMYERQAGFLGENDYLIATNCFFIPQMQPSVPFPMSNIKDGDPSSWFRFMTIKHLVENNFGNIDVNQVMEIMKSVDYWDPTIGWQYNIPLSNSMTINSIFAEGGGTLVSSVAIPEDGIVYICTGNPGITYGSMIAPHSTGQYVRFELADSPNKFVNKLKDDTTNIITSFFVDLESMDVESKLTLSSALALNDKIASLEDKYWRGINYLSIATLNNDINTTLALYSKAATCFSEVQANIKWLSMLLKNYLVTTEKNNK